MEKWKNVLGKGDSVCTLLMDLSKAFDTHNHDLLLEKFKTDGFSKDAFTFVQFSEKVVKKEL